MKKICLALAVTVCLCFADARGQAVGPAEEKKALTERSFNLFQQGKLEDAIELAAKVVELEKNSSPAGAETYVNAVLNLARMKRDNVARFRAKLADKNSAPRQLSEFSRKANDNAREAEELFREALNLNETNGRSLTAQTADIKSELAWLIHNYFPVDDRVSPERASTRSRIDEAEKLYAESLALNEQTRGKDASETLFVVLAFGHFYLRYDNFEKALPFYERYIETVESKHGRNHPDLVNALRPYAQILFATFQEEESNAAIKKIEEITAQKEELAVGKLELALRSKDAVTFAAKLSSALKSKNEGFRSKLAASGGSLSRGAFDAARPRVIYTPVRVTVDENGKVIEAVAETKDPKMRERAEQEISKWFVRPFIYNGVTRKTRGYLTYSEAQ